MWGSAPAPLRACARHHSSCATLRLRFNLPQPAVSIIRAAPQNGARHLLPVCACANGKLRPLPEITNGSGKKFSRFAQDKG
jgi:hypothetical protein